MASRPLPDPVWAERPSSCVICGYSLEGLDSPGRCPECGAPFDREVLILAGVPSRPGGPLWRRMVWGVLIGAALVYFNLLGIFLMLSWQGSLVLAGAITIAVVAMLVTSPRERRGRERFIFSTAGVARVPLTETRTGSRVDSLFTPWGHSNNVTVKRHSAFWRRLTIGYTFGSGRRPVNMVFDAAVRCTDADEPLVLSTIRGYLSPAQNPRSPAGIHPQRHA